MRWAFWRKPPAFDPGQTIAEVSGSIRTEDTDLDRYREFRKVLLGSDEGKRVLNHILSACHIYRTSFRDDPYITAFKEGERNVGLTILSILNTEPPATRPTSTKEKA